MRPLGLAMSLKISALSSLVVFLVMLMGDRKCQIANNTSSNYKDKKYDENGSPGSWEAEAEKLVDLRNGAKVGENQEMPDA